jgi:hypothetical protein
LKSRRYFLFVNTLILLLSFLTALGILPGPDMVGIALAFYSLFLLPGFVITRLLSPRGVGLLEDICMIFLGGLLFLSLMLLLGFVPGVSYRGIAIAGFVVNITMLLLLGGRGSRVERERISGSVPVRDVMERRYTAMRISAVLLLFVVCFVLFYGSGETRMGSDALDHLSYVRRSLDSGVLFPNDSFYRGGDGAGFDPRKGIWHPMLALWAYQGEISPEMLWRMLPSFIAFFGLAFFLLFAFTVTGSSLLAPVVLLLLLLFYRGDGIAWLVKTGFSRNIAQFVLWGCVAFLIRYAETGRRDLLFWVFAASFVGTACHLVFALNMAVTCLALLLFILFFGYGRSWLGRGVTSMVVAAVAAALPITLRAAFTPHQFNLIHTHRQGMLILTDTFALVDPAELLARLGSGFFFALLFIPFFVWAADGGERRKLTWMLFLVPVLIVLNPLTGEMLERKLGYFHYRILYAAPLLCYLGLAIAGLLRIVIGGAPEGRAKGAGMLRADRTRGGRRSGKSRVSNLVSRLLAAGLLALFIFFPFRYSLPGARSSLERIIGGGSDLVDARTGFTERLCAGIPKHSVVASDPRTSYMISAFTDHFVTITLDQHCSPVDTAALHRLRETRDLFSPAVPFSESAGWLLEEGVDYLLVNTGYSSTTDFFATVPAGGNELAYEKFKKCEGLLEEILSLDGFHLFRLDREALASGEVLSCSDSTGGASGCMSDGERRASPFTASDGVVLEGIVTGQGEVAPGDTLRGHFCWSSDREIEFGLPYQWTIRMDRDFPKGSFYRHWYGKQYRRRMEQEADTFYRFTYSGPISGGREQPDQWGPGRQVRQDFTVPVNEWLGEGTYVMRVSLRRIPYLPNRTLGDYFLNEDSFHGVPFGSIRVVRDGDPWRNGGDVDEGRE